MTPAEFRELQQKKPAKRKRENREASLAVTVAEYMQLNHEDIDYRFDFAADTYLSKTQQGKMKELHGEQNKGFPDMTIFAMRKGFGALLIELKDKSPYRKDGELLKSDHLETQNNRHIRLRAAGYKVQFSTGYDETIKLIENYLN